MNFAESASYLQKGGGRKDEIFLHGRIRVPGSCKPKARNCRIDWYRLVIHGVKGALKDIMQNWATPPVMPPCGGRSERVCLARFQDHHSIVFTWWWIEALCFLEATMAGKLIDIVQAIFVDPSSKEILLIQGGVPTSPLVPPTSGFFRFPDLVINDSDFKEETQVGDALSSGSRILLEQLMTPAVAATCRFGCRYSAPNFDMHSFVFVE